MEYMEWLDSLLLVKNNFKCLEKTNIKFYLSMIDLYFENLFSASQTIMKLDQQYMEWFKLW